MGSQHLSFIMDTRAFKSIICSCIFLLIFTTTCITASSSLATHNERTLDLDLSDYGIDLDALYERLFSPSSLVNQVALTFTTTSMAVIGFIIAGILFQQLKAIGGNGPYAELITYFEAFLSPQVMFLVKMKCFTLTNLHQVYCHNSNQRNSNCF